MSGELTKLWSGLGDVEKKKKEIKDQLRGLLMRVKEESEKPDLMLERVWRKGNPLALLVGMQTNTATMENSVEIP